MPKCLQKVGDMLQVCQMTVTLLTPTMGMVRTRKALVRPLFRPSSVCVHVVPSPSAHASSEHCLRQRVRRQMPGHARP